MIKVTCNKYIGIILIKFTFSGECCNISNITIKFSWPVHISSSIFLLMVCLCRQKRSGHAEVFYVRSTYRQTANIWRTLGGNSDVDHWDVFGASPVGAAPTTSSFSTGYDGLSKDNCMAIRVTFKFRDLMRLILEVWRYIIFFISACYMASMIFYSRCLLHATHWYLAVWIQVCFFMWST